MRVAAIQFKARRSASPMADLDRSRDALVALAQRAAPGRDLVVLPEMAATGYIFADAAAVGAVAEASDGPTLRALAPVAREHRCWLVAGFPERDGDRLYNSAIVVNPRGDLAEVYRKTLLYDEDLHWATPGDTGYVAFDTGSGRFGVGICMDLNDDAFVAWVAGAELDAVAFPTNWVHEGSDIDLYTYWAWRMAPVESVALVAANTWGVEGQTRFSGRSCVLHRRRILGQLPETGDGIVRVTLPRGPGAATSM